MTRDLPGVPSLPGLAPYLLILGLLLISAPVRAQTASVSSDAVFEQSGPLNPGLPSLERPPDLETPQASLENFVLSCKKGDYLRAAWSLDLGNIPRDRQKELGPEYARMLMTVMEQKVWLDWTSIPDRPDGEHDDGSMDTLSALTDHSESHPIRALKLRERESGRAGC